MGDCSSETLRTARTGPQKIVVEGLPATHPIDVLASLTTVIPGCYSVYNAQNNATSFPFTKHAHNSEVFWRSLHCGVVQNRRSALSSRIVTVFLGGGSTFLALALPDGLF
jgi:hypothetical protein